ncbi:nucleotidyltransferase family protein [Xanthocytophaga flava]|nr:hypothetical protein [Xanthocytophaga flavus]
MQNLRDRRFDRENNSFQLSESYTKSLLPDNIKYLLESMRPIADSYNAKTLEAARRVQEHLERGFRLSFNRAYRTQGSVRTRTNIKVHSDFDLLTLINAYFYLAPGLPNPSPYIGDSDSDIEQLRTQAIRILKDTYDEVDTTGKKSVSIFNKALHRKVDVVFCWWYDTTDYREKNDEYYRGIYLYDSIEKRKIMPADYPFAHLWNVNYKGDQTNDGARRGIRLLKNLKADSDVEIDLSSFQLTSIVHAVDNQKVYYTKGTELKIAQAISDYLTILLFDSSVRKAVKSPNKTEYPLEDDKVVPEIKKLKSDLDQLIADCTNEFSNYFTNQAILSY